VFYVLAQVAGGFVGLRLAGLVLGGIVGRPPVMWLVTVPGAAGSAASSPIHSMRSPRVMSAP